MKTNRGFNTETKNILTKVMGMFVTSLKAEEMPPQNGGENGQAPTPINYEDLIAKARKEEKDKLYKQLQGKDAKINELTEKNNNLMLKVGQQEEEIASLKKDLNSAKEGGAKIESEELAKANETIKALEQEVANLKNSTVDVNTLEEGIRAEYEVKMYRLEKIHEVGKSIIPELVSGSTKEEIDASIELSKQRYLDIVGSVAPQPTPQPKQTLPTGNPSGSQFNMSTLKPEDIAKLSPKEWAEYRRTIGLK